MLYMPMKQGPFTLKRTIIEGDKRADIRAEFLVARPGLTVELEQTPPDAPELRIYIEYLNRNKLGMWTEEGEMLGADAFERQDLADLECIQSRWRGHTLNAGTTKQQALIGVTEKNRGRPLSHEEIVVMLKLNGAYEQEIPDRYDFVFDGWGGEIDRLAKSWKPRIEKFEAELRNKRWPTLPGKDGVAMRMRIRSEITKLFVERHPKQPAAHDVGKALAGQAKIERVNQLYRYGSAWLHEILPVSVSDQVIELMNKPSDDERDVADANAQTLQDLGLRFSFERIPKRTDRSQTDWDQDAKHYLCRLTKDGETVEVEYSMGSAHRNPPTLAEVMECLREDVRVGPDWDEGFEDWCETYGFDPDSRKAERIYATCVELREKMQRMLGEELFEAWEQGE